MLASAPSDRPRGSAPDRPPPWRIVIAGAGIAGMALALALKRPLGAAVEVVVCDPLADRTRVDERAFALSAGARRMLEALAIWPVIAAQGEPIRAMVITDSRLADPVRPAFLTFGGEAGPGEPYATMMPAAPLAAALRAAALASGVLVRAQAVVKAAPSPRATRADLEDGGSIEAALVVACDGARSRLREDAGIGWITWRYRQVGIVATIGHERDHEGRAFEHFLPAGPFATLPLPKGGSLGHRSSIVWTEDAAKAETLLALAPADLAAEIERRFGPRLGRLAIETGLRAHPLAFGIARRFSAERLALLGDCAHEIHPLAGQGLNLGLADAAALAEEISAAVRLGLDPGAPDGLAAYTRRRRPDTVAMAVATDGLNRLFSNDAMPARLMRDLGLGLVDRMPGLKQLFIRRAAAIGARETGPRRGERP